ncbi:hypothetical protein M3Y96_00789200 [Aphelenchoides besseyi]|nr:hypothetical protein M3Y96_00789200 [Aphelenchoides besseyi]
MIVVHKRMKSDYSAQSIDAHLYSLAGEGDKKKTMNFQQFPHNLPQAVFLKTFVVYCLVVTKTDAKKFKIDHFGDIQQIYGQFLTMKQMLMNAVIVRVTTDKTFIIPEYYVLSTQKEVVTALMKLLMYCFIWKQDSCFAPVFCLK